MADINMSLEVSHDPLIPTLNNNFVVSQVPNKKRQSKLNPLVMNVGRKRAGILSKRFSNYMALFTRSRGHLFWKTLLLIQKFSNRLKKAVSDKERMQKLKEYHLNFLEKNIRAVSNGDANHIRFLNINVSFIYDFYLYMI
jgi:hypothetical protein